MSRPAAAAQARTSWWEHAVGYVFDPLGADGGPAGGLVGIVERLADLAWLGVDAVLLPHFQPSPEPGSDALTDLTGVDERFGGPRTFDALITEAHQLGLKVVVVTTPNHTSRRHPWFEASRSSVDDPKRGWYHWREPGPGGRPPNNWVATTGGSAWSLDEQTQQHHLNLFGPDRPDLNWNHPGVVRAFDDVLTSWLERGVDGFCVDDAQALVKNMLMPDNPLRFPLRDDMSAREVFVAYEHRYDLDQTGVVDLYRRWRRLVAPADAVLIGNVELRDNDPNRVSRYVARQDGLHRAIHHAPRHVPWEPQAMWDCFRDALDAAPTDLAWSASGAGHPPAVERFGGGQLGVERLLAYSVLLALLPGMPLLHQGDELALAAGQSWADELGAQRQTEGSPLHRQRALLGVRRMLVGSVGDDVEWLTARTDPVFAFRRGRALAVCNTGADPATLDLPAGVWRVRYRSGTGELDTPAGESLSLAAPEGVVLSI